MVAWQTVILPQAEGGLGIIDPELQSQALLGKLVIRGLTPGGQTWKLLFQQGISSCTDEEESGYHLSGGSLPLHHLSAPSHCSFTTCSQFGGDYVSASSITSEQPRGDRSSATHLE